MPCGYRPMVRSMNRCGPWCRSGGWPATRTRCADCGHSRSCRSVVGADLATPGEAARSHGLLPITSPRQSMRLIAAAQLTPLRQFILPGGCLAAAQLHFARTVCRRAERWTISLAREEPINEQVPMYLNRLSDFLFHRCSGSKCTGRCWLYPLE